MDNKKKAVDYRFKLLYAIGIIMVVSGHCNGGGLSLWNDWFPYRGMVISLFAFCSGYFYKNQAEQETKKYIQRKIETLIIPLYSYTIFYGILVEILRNMGFMMGEDLMHANVLLSPIKDGHQFIYNMGGWFIAPLFMVEVYNVFIRKAMNHVINDLSEWSYFGIAIVLGGIGNYMAYMGYRTGWWLVLVRLLHFIPFYEMGILYKRKLESYDKKISSFYYFTVIIAIKLALIYSHGGVQVYTPSWCDDFTENPVMPIIIGGLGIAFWLRAANVLEPTIGRSKWVNIIADNTYSIMMNQFLGFMAVKTVFAIMSIWTRAFEDFDWFRYKTDIWYYYVPKGIAHTMIIYVMAGLIIPILMQKTMDILKERKYI